jgi:colanic acid/amylovoran biosynthesis glycosyltransferase
MITMVHANLALVQDDRLWTDQKFISGMAEYGRLLPGEKIVSIHPQMEWESRHQVMDLVGIPLSELGFQVETLRLNGKYKPEPGEVARLEPLIRESSLVSGAGFELDQVALRHGVPLVVVLEYNFRTQVEFAMANLKGLPRKALRLASVAKQYLQFSLATIRRASLVHCNGYPIYEEVRPFNRHRFLYLDSRMREENLISRSELEARLSDVGKRPLRLIYSGRFERAKGPLEVIRVARRLKELNCSFEMDLYGQGSQEDEMRGLVKRSGLDEVVRINKAVPYESLLKILKTKDAFVCCHVQDDPSCTYLEAMGCGLPVIGYGNRMLSRLCEESGGGLHDGKKPELVAQRLFGVAQQTHQLKTLSRSARNFAGQHTFEHEFRRRVESLKKIVESSAPSTS